MAQPSPGRHSGVNEFPSGNPNNLPAPFFQFHFQGVPNTINFNFYPPPPSNFNLSERRLTTEPPQPIVTISTQNSAFNPRPYPQSPITQESVDVDHSYDWREANKTPSGNSNGSRNPQSEAGDSWFTPAASPFSQRSHGSHSGSSPSPSTTPSQDSQIPPPNATGLPVEPSTPSRASSVGPKYSRFGRPLKTVVH